MVSSPATTVSQYIASLPPDRKKAIETVRRTVKKNLPKGYVETIQYGMISYVVPLSRFPDTYNGQPLAVASLASQKTYMSIYLMGVYGDDGTREKFEKAYKKSGKKLDMGKSCLRFRSADDLALDVIGDVIRSVSVETFLEQYEDAHGSSARRRTAAKKAPAKKRASNKKTAKKKAARAR